jgi:hypothetical protein
LVNPNKFRTFGQNNIMATVLDKDIIRETTVKFDDREVQITLTDKQTIYMKLKGMKSGGLEISISDLYRQLKGEPVEEKVEVEEEEEKEEPVNGLDLSDYKGDKRYLISLHDIRHAFNVTPFELGVKTRVDEFLVNLINERKKSKK